MTDANEPSDEVIRSVLVGIMSDGFNRSMQALEDARAIDRSKMQERYRGVGSEYYDLVTKQLEYTAECSMPLMRKLIRGELGSERNPHDKPEG